jgi:hypothetical protein
MSRLISRVCALIFAATFLAFAQTPALQTPSDVQAGKSFSISSRGRGKATLYVIGPSRVMKQPIELGHEISIRGDDVSASGTYQLVACNSDGCANARVQVLPSAPARLSFLLHPSRVPVAAPNAVNATAIVFDRYHNTVLAPAKVNFRLTLAGQPPSTRTVESVRGIAAFQMDARPKQGALEVVASVGDTAEPRVIQQVASEACGLRMTATPSGRKVMLQTDPIKDCAGNPLPDGTIVSFTKVDSVGKSSVDTPIKKDRAIAQFELTGPARISVACGVVSGNELSVGGGQ